MYVCMYVCMCVYLCNYLRLLLLYIYIQNILCKYMYTPRVYPRRCHPPGVFFTLRQVLETALAQTEASLSEAAGLCAQPLVETRIDPDPWDGDGMGQNL